MDRVKKILDFLEILKVNNNREWFNENKSLYIELKNSFELMMHDLINAIAEFDESVKYLTPSECVYRIYRDVRFSPNKLPYKLHFAANIAPSG